MWLITDYPSRAYRGLSQCLQTNVRAVPLIGKDRLLQIRIPPPRE